MRRADAVLRHNGVHTDTPHGCWIDVAAVIASAVMLCWQGVGHAACLLIGYPLPGLDCNQQTSRCLVYNPAKRLRTQAAETVCACVMDVGWCTHAACTVASSCVASQGSMHEFCREMYLRGTLGRQHAQYGSTLSVFRRSLQIVLQEHQIWQPGPVSIRGCLLRCCDVRSMDAAECALNATASRLAILI